MKGEGSRSGIQRAANSLRDQGLAVQTRILAYAHPATAILNEPADGAYDLLALEAHGRHGLPRLFLGSVRRQGRAWRCRAGSGASLSDQIIVTTLRFSAGYGARFSSSALPYLISA